jgi:hypothetical protein
MKIWIVKHSKAVAIVLTICLVSTAVVYAAMKKISNTVENSFSAAASVNPVVEQTFVAYRDLESNDVRVNVGDTDYPVYVRATIVVTWQNNEGEIYGTVPEEGVDYVLTINTSKWDYNNTDHFYYYRDAVPSNTSTQALITNCRELNEGPAEGYTLSVDVIAQTVQAVGGTDDESHSASADAWE